MKKMRITESDYIKANRKASREAEIENHTHSIGFKRVHKSKKVYDRKRNKAEDKTLPYLFLHYHCRMRSLNDRSIFVF